MTKKIYVDVFVFLLLHIYRMHLSPAVRKMCPILDVPLKQKQKPQFFVKRSQSDVGAKRRGAGGSNKL